MTVLRGVYSTADCMSLQLGTVTTVTTGFVGKSHGLLMNAMYSKKEENKIMELTNLKIVLEGLRVARASLSNSRTGHISKPCDFPTKPVVTVVTVPSCSDLQSAVL